MAKKSYSEKLKDPRWQKKRLEIFERDGWKCRCCGATDKTLCIHHKVYKKGAEPWDYHERLLLTMCENCHESEHYWYPKMVDKLGTVLSACGLSAAGVEILANAINERCEKPLEERREMFDSLFSAVGVDTKSLSEEGANES